MVPEPRAVATRRHEGIDRPLAALLAAYAVASLLLVAVSARLWWQTPLALIAHEFDYFLGLFPSPDAIDLGRLVHLGGCAIVGGLYFTLAVRIMRSPQALSVRQISVYGALIALIYTIGMPWLSPDVFFYIGTGWLESHYGLSPYLATVHSVPGHAQDQMFANIFPGFLFGTTAYGPLFQKVAAVVAGLSGGNELLALALHKAASLALHGACSFLVWRLAPARFARMALFSYAANPVICFSVLTCAHNDHWMNLFVLLALLAILRRHWLLAGAALGVGFGFKYFPLVYLPVLGMAALVQGSEGRHWAKNVGDAAKVGAGFAAAVVLAYLPYAEALTAFSTVAASGVPVYRNSIHHLLDVLTYFVLPALFGTPDILLPYAATGRWLRLSYMGIYAVVLLAMVPRLRRDLFRGSVEACLVMTLLYFIVVNNTNQEWYLTWLMGFALVLPLGRAHMLAWRLSALFLPLVIYTIKNLFIVQLFANAALYLLVLVLGGQYLVRMWRASRVGPTVRHPPASSTLT